MNNKEINNSFLNYRILNNLDNNIYYEEKSDNIFDLPYINLSHKIIY